MGDLPSNVPTLERKEMTNRQNQVIKMALLFAMSNLDDLIEAFGGTDGYCVNGVKTDPPTEAEVEQAIMEFQDVL